MLFAAFCWNIDFFRSLISPLKESEFARAFRRGPLPYFQDLKRIQLQPESPDISGTRRSKQ
jgi:hypothetical protein